MRWIMAEVGSMAKLGIRFKLIRVQGSVKLEVRLKWVEGLVGIRYGLGWDKLKLKLHYLFAPTLRQNYIGY
eukprot:1319590-Amphidinium_carterae.1